MVSPRLVLLLGLVAMATAQAGFEDCFNGGEDACRAEEGAAVCSGRGSCICGQCSCNSRPNPREMVSGQFCECDNFTCGRWHGKLCGGADHGVCECGECRCRPGWVGEVCDCSTNQDTCIAPGSREVCSGNGECECGACKCHVTQDGRYTGRYCQDCPTCPNRCSDFRACVECEVFSTGDFKSNCSQSCSDVTITKTDLPREMESGDYFCSFFLSDPLECRYKFIFSGANNKVYVPPKQKCLKMLERSTGGGPSVKYEALYVVELLVAAVAFWACAVL